jgi:hypothetical protein
VPIGEDEHGHSRKCKGASVRFEAHFTSSARPVAHDHQRRALDVGQEQPSLAFFSVRPERDVSSRWVRSVP